MKKFLILHILILILVSCTNPKNQDDKRVIIAQDNGNIILAYKGFETFLNSPKSWNDYEKQVLNPFPTVKTVHQRYIHYGLIDSIQYQKQVTEYTLDEFNQYFDGISDEQVINLYNFVIKQMDAILTPLNKIDFCLFLPYGDCFVQDVGIW